MFLAANQNAHRPIKLLQHPYIYTRCLLQFVNIDSHFYLYNTQNKRVQVYFFVFFFLKHTSKAGQKASSILQLRTILCLSKSAREPNYFINVYINKVHAGLAPQHSKMYKFPPILTVVLLLWTLEANA